MNVPILGNGEGYIVYAVKNKAVLSKMLRELTNRDFKVVSIETQRKPTPERVGWYKVNYERSDKNGE